MLRNATLALFLLLSAFSAFGQTQTTYTLPSAGCVQLSNCIIYGPGELFSLWTATAPTNNFAIFNVNSWANGFQTIDSYRCTGFTSVYQGAPTGQAPAGSTVELAVTCGGADEFGVPFKLAYTIYAYSYYSRGGGGKGGGGAGTRYAVTGGTATITSGSI
jgi:hypothetical protein